MADTTKPEPAGGAYGYGKAGMPVWAWVLLYLVIGGIVYYAGFTAWKAKHPAADPYSATPTTRDTPSAAVGGAGGSIYNY